MFSSVSCVAWGEYRLTQLETFKFYTDQLSEMLKHVYNIVTHGLFIFQGKQFSKYNTVCPTHTIIVVWQIFISINILAVTCWAY